MLLSRARQTFLSMTTMPRKMVRVCFVKKCLNTRLSRFEHGPCTSCTSWCNGPDGGTQAFHVAKHEHMAPRQYQKPKAVQRAGRSEMRFKGQGEAKCGPKGRYQKTNAVRRVGQSPGASSSLVASQMLQLNQKGQRTLTHAAGLCPPRHPRAMHPLRSCTAAACALPSTRTQCIHGAAARQLPAPSLAPAHRAPTAQLHSSNRRSIANAAAHQYLNTRPHTSTRTYPNINNVHTSTPAYCYCNTQCPHIHTLLQ